MVVDDNELMRIFYADSLARFGYEVEAAGNGFEGFELFSQKRFDLVITDCYMPEIDGCYLSGLIKKRSPNTPVLMITGQSQDKISEKIAASEVDWLIFKQFAWEQLLHIVRSFLANNSSEWNTTETYDHIRV